MTIDASPSSQRTTFARGLKVQANVIGAIILRELHTRYGRENVGYLWMFLEPMTLALAVSSMHAFQKTSPLAGDVRAVPFAIGGYCVFIIFRGIVTRGEGALESNAPLLYHRMVTLFDMLTARALLEGAGVGMCLVLLLFFATALGLADPPVRPLALIGGVVLMLWFAWAISMLVCSITYENRLAARLVHPITYILMPLSGAFYRLQWIPQPYRGWITWFPMTQIFELVRYGQFKTATDEYVNITYIIGWCMILTYIGIICLKIVRRHVRLR